MGLVSTASAALSHVALGVVAILISFGVYLIRNVFFHPLRHYPGPKTWAASRLPWCWNQYHGRLNHRIAELHEQYGSVVRVAPDEISYVTASAWKTIYGPRSVEMAKDPNFKLTTPNGVQNIMIADRETHARQRRLLSRAFSDKALREQGPILDLYCNKLCFQLESHSKAESIDMGNWYTFAAFDLIGELAFGRSFDCLDSGIAHAFVQAIKNGSRELMITQMMNYYGLLFLRPILTLFSKKGVAGSRASNMRRATETVKARVSRGPTADRKDFWHYILGNVMEDDVDVNDSKHGMTKPEMYANAFSLTGAGSESTATALASVTFLLLRHPKAYRRVVNEVRDAFHNMSDISVDSTAGTLPYLDAALNEAMRLYPPVAITFPRQVPPGGEVIDGRFVPGGYIVGVNHLACYRSEANFKDATQFRPERWLEKSKVECFQPFSYGPRNCLGKNLAWAEMRLLLARVLWQFDMELVDNENTQRWINDEKIWGFWHRPTLSCKLSPAQG